MNGNSQQRTGGCGTTARDRGGRDARTDGGYILVTLGLMIIPLMAFAALAVDVGSWYARTTEMQKAADAAALAGVVWAPDYNKARTVAAKTLTDNGFTATSASSQTNGNITITMLPGGQVNSFTVTITDAKAPMFFSKVFTNNPVSLTRELPPRCTTCPIAHGEPAGLLRGHGVEVRPAGDHHPTPGRELPLSLSAVPEPRHATPSVATTHLQVRHRPGVPGPARRLKYINDDRHAHQHQTERHPAHVRLDEHVHQHHHRTATHHLLRAPSSGRTSWARSRRRTTATCSRRSATAATTASRPAAAATPAPRPTTRTGRWPTA